MENLDKFLPAFLEAQRNLKTVIKGENNLFFGTMYADLPAVMQVAKEALHPQGLMIIQLPSATGQNENQFLVSVETRIYHTSGQFIAATATAPVNSETNKAGKTIFPNAQMVGSAITYLRRYCLSALLGIVSDVDDDDGKKASGNQYGYENNPKKQKDPDLKLDPAKATGEDVGLPPKTKAPELTEEQNKIFSYLVLGKEAKTVGDVSKVNIAKTPITIKRFMGIIRLATEIYRQQVSKEVYTAAADDLCGTKSMLMLTEEESLLVMDALFNQPKKEKEDA